MGTRVSAEVKPIKDRKEFTDDLIKSYYDPYFVCDDAFFRYSKDKQEECHKLKKTLFIIYKKDE
jgi:regulator of replication initiation timing